MNVSDLCQQMDRSEPLPERDVTKELARFRTPEQGRKATERRMGKTPATLGFQS